MGDWAEPVMIAAAAGAGLMAGLFFAFSNFVMRALARLPDTRGMAAMQSINVTVLNPLFFLVFFGTGVLSVLAAVAGWRAGSESSSLMALTGAVLYLAGSIGVTAARNVPLNERLARVPADDAGAGTLWPHYVTRWTRWNHVRTVACLAAAVLFAAAAAA